MSRKGKTTRREFLVRAGIAGAGLAGGALLLRRSSADAVAAKMQMRPLGRTGLTVSALCVGGAHIGTASSYEESERIIREAIDGGVNFFDNAWEYSGGQSEERMGRALAGRRDKVVLMTKMCVHGQDKKKGMRDLEESLKRLRTDYLDLWQIHQLDTTDEVEAYFKPGGAIEALEDAVKQGKVRYVGFTGHSSADVHLKMLERKYPFHSCQMPINCFDQHYKSFREKVLPELAKQNIAALGMKPLAGNAAAVQAGVVTVEEALRYSLSLPLAAVVNGIDSVEKLRQNIRVFQNFVPMTDEEQAALRERVRSRAVTGEFEYYKV